MLSHKAALILLNFKELKSCIDSNHKFKLKISHNNIYKQANQTYTFSPNS